LYIFYVISYKKAGEIMTSRERLLKVLNHEIPDHVPVAPDTSNMIPARLKGKPFWELYLYQDPPIWKAYIDCVKYFGFDSLMDGYVSINFEELGEINKDWEEVIIYKNEERIVTQKYKIEKGKQVWRDKVTVYHRSNPPADGVPPSYIGLPDIPLKYEPVVGRKKWPQGEELLKLVKDDLGDHGLVGVWCGTSKLIGNEEEIYDFYDNPEKYYRRAEELLKYYRRRFDKLMSLDVKPDFICTGGSGTLIHQTPTVFRELALPIIKEITAMAKAKGIPTHVHSCGPEKELIKILVEETDLTVVDPLEIPPMGDCNLRELKQLYGDKIVLKGNLHTTNVMLRGSVIDVKEACKRAIDDAAEGGNFILSTGDQCGRDTPDENIFAMVEMAKTYGKY
jgi:uroporphyrinogen decarboxylase